MNDLGTKGPLTLPLTTARRPARRQKHLVALEGHLDRGLLGTSQGIRRGDAFLKEAEKVDELTASGLYLQDFAGHIGMIEFRLKNKGSVELVQFPTGQHTLGL